MNYDGDQIRLTQVQSIASGTRVHRSGAWLGNFPAGDAPQCLSCDKRLQKKAPGLLAQGSHENGSQPRFARRPS
jgi:hypothetical protein